MSISLVILLLLNIFVWSLVFWQKQKIKQGKSKLEKLKIEAGGCDR